jgi:RsiW-degrading membrane proteinase PrsW (M82 family)
LPFIAITGISLDRLLLTRAKGKKSGFFTSKEIEPELFTKSYRNKFIGQKLMVLGIMVAVGVVSALIAGILGIIPACCCLLSPIIYPFVLLTITAPAIAWVYFVYASDPYEPEPRAFIILGLLWGMLSTFPSLFLNTFNDTWMGDYGLSTAVVSAPIFEELFKSMGFFFIFSQIRDETDGMLYGSAFGAGFALLENFLYGFNAFMAGGGILFIVLITFRSLFNILGHMLGPAIIGFLIGAGKQWFAIDQVNRRNDMGKALIFYMLVLPVLIVIGYVVSALNHALWNFIASIGNFLAFVFISIPLGMFQWAMFLGLVLFSFILSTRRYNKKLAEHRRHSPFYMR